MRPGRLHVMTDETLQSRFSHAELAQLAFRGGADVVQLREKREIEERRVAAWGRAMRVEARRHGGLLIVNDRVALARAVGAGVHLGREDVPPAAARELLGGRVLIGATAHSLDEARRLDGEPVDYIGVGPVFGTTSKTRPAPALGLHELRRIVAAVSSPVVAIGNVAPDNVAAVLETGAFGIAVLSGVVLSADPVTATARYREAIDRQTGGDHVRSTA